MQIFVDIFVSTQFDWVRLPPLDSSLMMNAQGWRTPCWRRLRKVPVSVRTAGDFWIMLSVSG